MSNPKATKGPVKIATSVTIKWEGGMGIECPHWSGKPARTHYVRLDYAHLESDWAFVGGQYYPALLKKDGTPSAVTSESYLHASEGWAAPLIEAHRPTTIIEIKESK